MPKISSDNLQTHLQEKHNISTVSSFLKEIIYGGIDGIVTTFAVVAGFTGANSNGSIAEFSFLTVLLFGLANLFADGASMGLGNFLSLRTEKKQYEHERQNELYEIRHNPASEKVETIEILMQKGYNRKDAKSLTDLYAKNEQYWADFMMNHELEMSHPGEEHPAWNGLATFCSFLVFGFIPLIPYVLGNEISQTFQTACIFTIGALIAIGVLRWRVTKEALLRCLFETVLVGSVAAVIAYIVGTFFRH